MFGHMSAWKALFPDAIVFLKFYQNIDPATLQRTHSVFNILYHF